MRAKTLLQKDRHLFLLLWFTIPLGVFMLAKSRMPLYVMPLFVPLSLVMANVWRTEIGPRLRESPLKWHAAVIGFTVWLLALTAFTVYPDRFPGARSNRPTARLFTSTLARMEEPSRLYWIYGGHQKFSIPFYMRRVVSYAERFDRHTRDLPPNGGEHQARVLYITRAILLPLFLKAPNPPVVLAKDDKYALIEWPRTKTPGEASAQVRTSGSGGAQRPDAGLPALHAPHPSGLYAVMLLILAGSRP